MKVLLILSALLLCGLSQGLEIDYPREQYREAQKKYGVWWPSRAQVESVPSPRSYSYSSPASTPSRERGVNLPAYTPPQSAPVVEKSQPKNEVETSRPVQEGQPVKPMRPDEAFIGTTVQEINERVRDINKEEQIPVAIVDLKIQKLDGEKVITATLRDMRAIVQK